MRILSLAGRRLAASIPTLFLILIGVFLLLQLAPGDTVDAMMAQMGGGDAATARELRKFYGLDVSVPMQLANYLWHLVRLDLGFSSIYGKPVATVILERLPPTLLLMTASLSFAFFFGLVFGVIASRALNRWPDTLISTLGLIFYATPSFWFGLMAIVVFSIYLQWLPAGGFEDIGAVQTGLFRVIDIARHLILPTLTLGLIFLAIYLRIMRASMLEVLNLDYVRTARAKGLEETRVVTGHVLRNALLPMVTLIGLQAGTMLGGSVVVESVFSLPGLGRLAYESVILERLPPTILLMTASLSFAFFFGLVFGVIAARGVNRWPDTLISTLGLIFYATPSFWFGLMAIVVFSVYLQWLPPGGFEDIGTVQTGIWRALDIASHLVLPTLTLGLIFLAIYLRIMRASMLEVLNLDYVRTARAKGLDETRVVTRHVLRNALLPMVTLIGLQAGTMLGGSVVVESVFSLPGLGRLAYESVVQRDLNTLLGIVFVSALLVIAVNFAVDLIYARLDPRITAD
jgi:peptide/nickel transport system permease protein